MASEQTQALLGEIDDLHKRADAGSYVAMADELGGMNSRLQVILPEVELDDAVQLMNAFYPLVFSGMVELGKTDAEIRDKLARTEDVTYVLKVDEVGFALCLKIANGEFSYAFSEPAEVNVTMKTDPQTLLELMTGQTDAIQAFMAGDVEADGELIKARGLRAVFEALGDKFGFRLMEF